MKEYLLVLLVCVTLLTALLIHEQREDRCSRELAGKIQLGLDGIGWSITP